MAADSTGFTHAQIATHLGDGSYAAQKWKDVKKCVEVSVETPVVVLGVAGVLLGTFVFMKGWSVLPIAGIISAIVTTPVVVPSAIVGIVKATQLHRMKKHVLSEDELGEIMSGEREELRAMDPRRDVIEDLRKSSESSSD